MNVQEVIDSQLNGYAVSEFKKMLVSSILIICIAVVFTVLKKFNFLKKVEVSNGGS